MNTAYIDLLEKRILELDNKDFDLEVWKSGTALLLARIFGDNNAYSKEIDDLKVDFSSWSLRDATSQYNPKETCKRQGREILELAVAELHLPTDQGKAKPDINDILDDKTGKLQEAIASKDEKALLSLLKKVNKEDLASLLVRLLIK